MKTYLQCIPCFARQALEAARFVTDDEAIQEQVLRRVLREISELDLSKEPPRVGRLVYQIVRELAGDPDPYREVKERYNRFALSLYPECKRRIQVSADPLQTAVRVAIAGNIIDFGIDSELDNARVHDAIEHALQAPLSAETFEHLRRAAARADTIVYVGDNAGEIVFDRLLIEQLPRQKVTFVVRGGPIINDVTLADAQRVGLADEVEVIASGCDAPGTVLDLCTEEFRRRLFASDLVIAKGQGNYETLSEIPPEAFFLLKAKCPVIAMDAGCEIGGVLFLRKPAQRVARSGSS